MGRIFFTGLNRYVNRQPAPFLMAIGFSLLVFVGIADYLTGTELSLSIFYLIPISLMAWFVNGKTGVLFSIISSLLQLATDLILGSTHSHPTILFWNHAVYLGFFLIIVLTLAALRKEYEKTLGLNDELRRKTEELAHSNAELEQFASAAAHDLRGPLISAGGHIRRLQRHYKERLDLDAHRLIAHALHGIARMEELINALLTYAKAGAKKKDMKVTNCNKAIEQAMKNLQSEIEGSAARVIYKPLPTVLADELQMVRLFQNLIGNAIKFHGKEPPYVRVSAEHGENEWVFSVCDNGIGIELENATRIFDIFQRLHSSSEYQGTGMGLAICKKIVEAHEGRIWVESEPGAGATFYFTIAKQSEPAYQRE